MNQMSNTIQKVFLKEGKYPKITFADRIGDGNYKCHKPAHDDFIGAMSELDIHLALLSGLLSVKTGYDKGFEYFSSMLSEGEKEVLTNIEAEGFTLSSNKAISITGSFIVPSSAKSMGICSPEQLFEADIYEYPFINELQMTVERLKYEANEYLEGKNGQAEQMEMFGDDGEVNTAAPKKRGRKKKDVDATDTVQDAEVNWDLPE